MKTKSEDTKLILVYRLDRIEKRGLVCYFVNKIKAAKRNITAATTKSKSVIVGLLA